MQVMIGPISVLCQRHLSNRAALCIGFRFQSLASYVRWSLSSLYLQCDQQMEWRIRELLKGLVEIAQLPEKECISPVF